MEEERLYWTPDYYGSFECKGGACRRSCCEGWPISMSMHEYFRLLSIDCSPKLRRRLDTGLHLAESPEPERYAQLLPNWLGRCPLHGDDGLCMLHAECGEEALCEICRMYPRSPRSALARECACSNSCERTLELLFADSAPLGFRRMELDFDPPVQPVPEALRSHYGPLRRLCIDRLQDRSRPLRRRIRAVGEALRALSPAFAALDAAGMDRVYGALPDAAADCAPDDAFALSFLAHINRSFGLGSPSVHDYAAYAADLLGLDAEEPSPESLARFDALRTAFRCRFPDWEAQFERLLVNHCFYESFPFSDRHETLWDEYLSLVAVYAYSTFLAVAWTTDHPTLEALIDVLSAAFRLIDHSAFDYNAAVILGRRMAVTPAQVDALVEGTV